VTYDFSYPRTIRAETANYIIRSVEPDDVTEGWTEWMLDGRAQRMLNAMPRRITQNEIRTYIAGFNRKTSHLLGIFEKATGTIIGMRAVYIDPVNKEYEVNMLIGEPEARGKGARKETRFAMHNFMFEELGLESARCTVVADNAEMIGVLAANGWRHENTSTKPRADGQGLVEIRHYRLTREAWQTTQAARAKREQAAA
jgi:RimJ/RimL family protein N-acetyltransferase